MKVSLSIKRSSLYRLEALLNDRGRFLSNKVLDASESVADEIMYKSAQQVPRETGALANSSFVEKDRQGVRFGYGGNNIQVNPKTGQTTDDYMVAVHEDLTAFHAVGKAKFLEDPINESLAEIESKLGQAVR